MIKQKKFIIPLVVIYTVLIGVMVITAINPAIDYKISEALTFSGELAYTIGNVREIWIEPVTLIPMCFILAATAVCALRTKGKNKLPQVLAFALTAGCVILSYQVIHRIVKYIAKIDNIRAPWIVTEGPFFSSLWWVKLICAVAGVGMAFLFLALAMKTDQKTLKKLQRALVFTVLALLLELAVIEGLKLIFGRMRYREWIAQNGVGGYWPWWRLNGKPASDAYKSFPSGHTANSMLLLPATFICDSLGKGKLGDRLRICHFVYMLAVMTSRIAAGAHFLSDVCGGALISLTICTVLFAIIFKDGKTAKE